jgi:hypothetical protein
LRRLTRRRAVGAAESVFPQFQQRLTTFLERDGQDPFIELLAGDTLDVARSAEPKTNGHRLPPVEFVRCRRGRSRILVWMIAAGPGYLGYGASLLWTGPHRDKPAHLRSARRSRRRHRAPLCRPDGLRAAHRPEIALRQVVRALPKFAEVGRDHHAAEAGQQLRRRLSVFVRGSARERGILRDRRRHDFEALQHSRQRSAGGEADPVTYRYPAWTGMPSETEERGGDLRAVIGTEAELDIFTDRPLQSGQILLDNGKPVLLTGGQNNVYRGTVKLDKDGVYHVAGIAEGQPVRVSEDFYIEARKPIPPQIALVRPGRGDYHANPIEEVTVAAKATDEYGLKGVTLHYSVNGGPDTTVDLLPKKGEKQADGSTTLSLEAFKLAPGDLISVYATAQDANAEAHTDIAFIQADPFEREFSQSQQSGGGGGGGGGGGNQQAQISQREKEIISATFRQQSDKNSTAQQAADIAKLLSQSQATLRDQAVTFSGRLQARELTDEVEAINDFQKDMMAASEAMSSGGARLQQQKWKDALPNEQKALQYLLRAEATFRADSSGVRTARRRRRGWRRRRPRSGRALRSRARHREEPVREPHQHHVDRRAEGAGNRRRAEEAR